MYGDEMTVFEVLGPEDENGERDTIGFTDDYTKLAAEMRLRQFIQFGKYPQGSVIMRSRVTDQRAAEAGYTTSHYDVPIFKLGEGRIA
jgi:hypothetical protein